MFAKKFENKTDSLFISDNLRAKNLRGFPDELLWFVVKWRFSLLDSIHSAAKTLQQITDCGCSTPSPFCDCKAKIEITTVVFSSLLSSTFHFVYINFYLSLLK